MRSIVVAGLVVLTSACSSSTSINARCPSPAIADPSVTRYVDQAARQARDWGTLVDLSWMDTDVNADLFIAPTGEVTDICYVSGNERLAWATYPLTSHVQQVKTSVLMTYKSQRPYNLLLRNAFVRQNELFFVY